MMKFQQTIKAQVMIKRTHQLLNNRIQQQPPNHLYNAVSVKKCSIKKEIYSTTLQQNTQRIIVKNVRKVSALVPPSRLIRNNTTKNINAHNAPKPSYMQHC